MFMSFTTQLGRAIQKSVAALTFYLASAHIKPTHPFETTSSITIDGRLMLAAQSEPSAEALGVSNALVSGSSSTTKTRLTLLTGSLDQDEVKAMAAMLRSKYGLPVVIEPDPLHE